MNFEVGNNHELTSCSLALNNLILSAFLWERLRICYLFNFSEAISCPCNVLRVDQDFALPPGGLKRQPESPTFFVAAHLRNWVCAELVLVPSVHYQVLSVFWSFWSPSQFLEPKSCVSVRSGCQRPQWNSKCLEDFPWKLCLITQPTPPAMCPVVTPVSLWTSRAGGCCSSRALGHPENSVPFQNRTLCHSLQFQAASFGKIQGNWSSSCVQRGRWCSGWLSSNAAGMPPASLVESLPQETLDPHTQSCCTVLGGQGDAFVKSSRAGIQNSWIMDLHSLGYHTGAVLPCHFQEGSMKWQHWQ